MVYSQNNAAYNGGGIALNDVKSRDPSKNVNF